MDEGTQQDGIVVGNVLQGSISKPLEVLTQLASEKEALYGLKLVREETMEQTNDCSMEPCNKHGLQ